MPSGPNKALAFAPTALRPLHDFSIGSRLRFQVQQSFVLTRVCAALRVVYPSGDFVNRGFDCEIMGLIKCKISSPTLHSSRTQGFICLVR